LQLNSQTDIKTPLLSKNNSPNKMMINAEIILKANLSNKTADFVKQKLSQALSPMKMYLTFNPETESNFE